MLFPLNLITLPDELAKLWIVLRSFDWQKDGETRAGCVAKVETLAKMAGKAERQTRANLARLEACGAIEIERHPPHPSRVLCTPENFDLAKVQLIAPCSPPQGKVQPVAGKGAAHRTATMQPTAPSLYEEVETVSRDREVETDNQKPRASALGSDLFGDPVLAKPEKAPRKPRAKREELAAIILPDWLPVAAWGEWLAFRKERRAPMPDTTARKQLVQLAAWRAAGHDPVAIIQHSIMQGYTGLFEPKGKPGAGGKWASQPNRPSAREDQEFTEADLDRLLEESK